MAQFQLPTVRMVNPTELSARFCGERSRFSLWVRAANMSWRGSDRPMKCEHVSPRVYAALTVEEMQGFGWERNSQFYASQLPRRKHS